MPWLCSIENSPLFWACCFGFPDTLSPVSAVPLGQKPRRLRRRLRAPLADAPLVCMTTQLKLFSKLPMWYRWRRRRKPLVPVRCDGSSADIPKHKHLTLGREWSRGISLGGQEIPVQSFWSLSWLSLHSEKDFTVSGWRCSTPFAVGSLITGTYRKPDEPSL